MLCSSPLLADGVGRGRVTQSSDGSLLISDAESHDSGVYTCRAYNSVGADTRSVQLMVADDHGETLDPRFTRPREPDLQNILRRVQGFS